MPAHAVDPVYYERSYYLGPDKGGEKGYALLAQAMATIEEIALQRFKSSTACSTEYTRGVSPRGREVSMVLRMSVRVPPCTGITSCESVHVSF